MNEHLARQRRMRRAAAIHKLGARVVFELLEEIGRRIGHAAVVSDIAEEFAAIDPEALRIAGGDRFPAVPITEVGK